MRVLLPFLSCALLAAQNPGSSAPVAGGQDVGVVAKLRPVSDVVRSGADFEVVLTLEVQRATKVDATVLSGTNLVCKVDGQPGATIMDKRDGQVEVAPGLKLERRLKISAGQAAPNVAAEKLANVSIEWPGLAGASCLVRVAPDSGKIDLDKLDYSKTKVILVTNFGEMTVGFRADKAPRHARNFVRLSKEGFYDGTRFHRIIKGFMIQGGCPNTKAGASGMPGTGNPGWTVDAEFNDIRHVRGILSMARSADPNSAGSQFFVMHGENPGLDNQYSAFGQLDAGMEVLDKIASTRVGPGNGNEMSKPMEDVWLYAAIVLPVSK